MLTLSDYTYKLPEERIAQTLAEPPDSCKLLVYDRTNNTSTHVRFKDLLNSIDPQSLLVFNTSKVVKARLYLPHLNGEIFFLQSIDETTFEALVRPWKKFKVWETIELPETDVYFTIKEISHNGRILKCNQPIFAVLEQHWAMPLPPYIEYDPSKSDAYQPIFAKEHGSVAAPTASLHFTPWLMESLQAAWVKTAETVLHIWLWTFKQVDVEHIKDYDIHTELIDVSYDLFSSIAQQKRINKPVIAVWTTVTRTTETMPYIWKLLSDDIKQHVWEDVATWRDELTDELKVDDATSYVIHSQQTSSWIRCETKLYLYPSKSFHVIDHLITNFHLPKSSLLMLVAAFMWYDEMMKLYKEAIENEYLFYSFGDAMLIK